MVNKSWFLLLPILVAGCTGSSEPQAATTLSGEPSATISEDAGSSTSVEPLRPYGDAPTTTIEPASTSAYISRRAMSDASIEVGWSIYDGAVEYHIHRVRRTSDERPPVEVMEAENTVHVATDISRFTDNSVEKGTRYWYGVRALAADGDLVAHGWHPTAAVTDVEPPSPVGGLKAVVEGGEVLVSWDRPEENYQLHAYQVLRGVDGEEPETISTTWDLDQRSFVDDRPPAAGSVTYAITSLDFHWNTSEPAAVTIDLPE